MPELPEVETARRLIADQALNRRIVAVDDADAFVCRPHTPGQLRDALVGRTLTSARRRGKTMWCETSGVNGSPEPGPELGIHLGMGGRIVVTAGDRTTGGGGWGPQRRNAGRGLEARPGRKTGPGLETGPALETRPALETGPALEARPGREAGPGKPEWNRFTLEFADGGRLALFDKRRLGRVRLNPDTDALGPDAEEVTQLSSAS